MPYDVSNPRLLIAGIALTLVMMAGVELLPPRIVDLTASDQLSGPFLITADGNENANEVQWLDEKQLRLRCAYAVSHPFMGCGLSYQLTGDDPTQGWDLRAFDSIEVELVYKGQSPYVRVALRNFDRRFSKVSDFNSARFHSINLRQRDIVKPLNIDLSELTVPEWWLQQYDLPREQNRPGLENASGITIDVPTVHVGEEHQLQVRRLVLKGQWVSPGSVHLGVLCAWLVAAALMALRGWTQLRQAHGRQQREIDALTTRTRQLRVEQEKLRRLATIDELTGVLNRRGLEQALDDYEAAAQGMTLVLLDIDHFKHINDRYGHDCGDEVLRRITAIIASNLRTTDVFGRWGGEEFVIACQGTRVRDAARLAEKLRDRVQQSEIQGTGGRIAVTASFGVALAPPGGSAADALKRADAALYRAKEGGRNSVETDETLQGDSPTTV
ncbi:MAG: GGDEF domain-containing protein [Rubrivivax sp.]|nr:MAG: GGDEF domain-containing protein [Rubrivivax sp.]